MRSVSHGVDETRRLLVDLAVAIGVRANPRGERGVSITRGGAERAIQLLDDREQLLGGQCRIDGLMVEGINREGGLRHPQPSADGA